MNTYKIILYLILMYDSVSSRNPEITENSKKDLQILSTQPTVEQQAVAYAKSFASSKALSFLSKVHVIEDICNRSMVQKIVLCEQVLQNDLLGFKFDLKNYEIPTCIDRTFDLTFVQDEAAINRKVVPMYSCPKVMYKDIETGGKTSLEYTFYVSRGENRKTAIMYFRKGIQDKKFPLYFVSRISFSNLIPKWKRKVGKFLPTTGKLRMTKAQERIRSLLEAKQLRGPYEKFTQLFSSMNICSLRRSHKIHLCKYNLGKLHDDLELDTEGYDGNMCKKFNVVNTKAYGAGPSKNGDRNYAKSQLTLLKCPSTIDDEEKRHPAPFEIKELTLYYLATNITPGYATLFGEKMGREGELNVELTNRIVTDKLLQQDILRTRFLPYPSVSERRLALSQMATYYELERRINDVTSWPTVQTPSTIARNDEMWFDRYIIKANKPQKYQNRWFMEDILVKFSRIKAMKLVYQRFRETYTSIDICELAEYQRRILCSAIVQSLKLMTDMFYPCIRQNITLVTRQSHVLESNNFSMWLCPTSSSHSYYENYVSKIHLRDSAILFRVYDAGGSQELVVYPDILLTGINRLWLANEED